MAYDDVIRNVGGFGIYQMKIYLLLCLPIIFAGFFLEHEYELKFNWNARWHMFFIAGTLLGGLIFGLMSDKLGRKPTYLVALVSLLIWSVPEYFIEQWISYEMIEFTIGVLFTGLFLVSFVLAIEIVDRTHRKYAGIIVMVFYTTYACRFWLKQIRNQLPWVNIVLIGLSLLFLSYYWLIPESGRWQQVMGRKQSAVDTSLKAARVNHVQVSSQTLYMLLDLKVDQEFNASSSIWNRLRSPNLICTSLLTIGVWFANSLVAKYFVYRVDYIPHRYISILAIALIPNFIVILLAIDRVGRRIVLSGSMVLLGTCILLLTLLHLHQDWLQYAACTFDSIAFALSYVTLHIFAAEQFPTVIRTFGLGVCFAVGGSGRFISMYFLEGAGLGIIMVVFGLLLVLLPETLAKPLPETFEDTTKSSARILETSADVKLAFI